MSRSRRLSGHLVALCLVLGACGGAEDDDTRSQPTTAAPSTTQSQEEEDEQALRQLAEDWYETIDAIYFGREDVEIAAEFIADPYLDGFVEQVEEFQQSGNQVRASAESTHEVRSVEVAGSTATVVECVIDAEVLLDPEGAVLNDTVQANLYSTSAERGPNGWRFIERETLSELDGESECPAS